jgi:two-component system sensor histidine kinase QseC
LLCGATVAGLYFYLREELIESFDAGLLSQARAVAGLVRSNGSDGGLEFLESRMPEFRSGSRVREYVTIFREDGTPWLVSSSVPKEGLVPPSARELSRRGKGGYDLALSDGRRGRAVWIRFRSATRGQNGGAVAPAPATNPTERPVILALASERVELDETLRHLLVALLMVAAVLCAGTLLLVTAVVRRGLTPLAAVADAATRIDAANLGYRFDSKDVPMEVRPICDRLNDLLARLEGAFERERRFTADIAHELRTPIAELKAMVEVALKWPPDAADSAERYRNELEVVNRMETQVSALLALARCESGREGARLERIDVREVGLAAWRPYAGAAAARPMEATIDLPRDVEVLADDRMLRALLGNLFSNAVEYAPPGGRIYCRSESADDAVRVLIGNTNPGVTVDDLGRLCEPFWRKDAARSDGRHAGLGLAIAHAYAKAQGIGIGFNVVGEFFEAALELPLAAGAQTVAPSNGDLAG